MDLVRMEEMEAAESERPTEQTVRPRPPEDSDDEDAVRETMDDYLELDDFQKMLGLENVATLIRKSGIRVLLLGGNVGELSDLGDRLAAHYNLRHFTSSDLIINEVDMESTVGVAMAPYVNSGKDVSDDIMVPFMADKIFNRRNDGDDSRPDTFLLSGFPRNEAQADRFEKIWWHIARRNDLPGHAFDFVVHVMFNHNVLEERRLSRFGHMARYYRNNPFCKYIEVPLALLEQTNPNAPKLSPFDAVVRLLEAAWLMLALEHTDLADKPPGIKALGPGTGQAGCIPLRKKK